MKEDLLHFIWEQSLFNSSQLKTTDNIPIQIISKGLKNSDSGPDFFNSKIKVGETTWAGNVEIHICSSDWNRHNHQLDKAYDNVVLHVVYNHDKPIFNQLGNTIPTLELKDIVNPSFFDNYKKLQNNKSWIPCATQLNKVDEFIVFNWLERLAFERLERKSLEIEITLKNNQNNWEETFYQFLLKYFGLKINALPFQQLAVKTPNKIFEKHNSILSIEALLFGQAGFLDDEIEDEYYLTLQKEYNFLKSKFSLNSIDKSIWKFMRLRPANFPTIRISQIASLFSKHPRLFSKIMEAKNIEQIQELFAVKASSYWDNHYKFNNEVKPNPNKAKNLGEITIKSLMINVVVPFTFVYGKSKNNQTIISKAIKLLEEVNPEKNSIIENWQKLGVQPRNSLQSQSLLELKNNYCSEKKCLNCNIGSKILSYD